MQMKHLYDLLDFVQSDLQMIPTKMTITDHSVWNNVSHNATHLTWITVSIVTNETTNFNISLLTYLIGLAKIKTFLYKNWIKNATKKYYYW